LNVRIEFLAIRFENSEFPSIFGPNRISKFRGSTNKYKWLVNLIFQELKNEYTGFKFLFSEV
jgi:hypothetical protein